MNWLGSLQQLGRAVMLPTMALPAAALLLSVGSLPWAAWGFGTLGEIAQAAGHGVFYYMPYLFAIGVAWGLSNQGGPAGLAALAGMFIYDQVISRLGDGGVQPSTLIGIIFGVLSGYVYNRFKHIKLPEAIQFFGGSRFVLLFMGLFSAVFAWFMLGMAPIVQRGLDSFYELTVHMGAFGLFLYGILYRVLTAFGLHHLLNNVYWFQLGTYETSDGTIVQGDLPRFFAGDPTAGDFMAGLFPIMMFALPAIAFAIIQEAREDLKPKVKKTFMRSALVCFLTGVSEQIEFAFLFASPYLYVLHALMAGFAMVLTYMFDIHHGFSYSAGFIDYVLNYHLSQNAWMIIPIGIVYGLVYYFLFRWAIRTFEIPTPGREEGSALEGRAGDIPYQAPLILEALGGKDNIVQVQSCMTRLRLTVYNDRQIDSDALKLLGSAGIIKLGGGNVQVVFGTYSELIREEINKLMQQDLPRVLFSAPVQGRMLPIDEVPDDIFAAKLVGNGVAFIPEKGELVSPVYGTVMHVYPTMHAIGISTPDGLEVLIHIGIDTSQLKGPFTAVVSEGDTVEPGQLLVKFDLAYLKAHAASLATPMVITNPDKVRSWSYAPFKSVKKGQSSVMSVVLNESNAGGRET
ncbi:MULTISPECIES: glucose PTS transporter subunit IIA [Paenibacillus]|uniref:PTS system, glucose subfamily, IIA subunit n=3 Tax=Paenibacillus TaxID=44249 RepID=G4HEN0_9BACL|nr:MULTISPECIES: glucose PTS transporter subunit IIA [Paenibacillus]ANY72068.1 PTS glucose transporter subunit IIA [Paenibacillus ihbetae]EHB65299.1 PTS system, glucose subfamily, IIA subunit [Paenibacillus lactis 154]MBP1896009.1 PTS system D-glucosamine-specific IIC component [Paenibacillus lactis]MCM3495470.1 glucose PTS transporter subunit IIA [Paenibacillus lactis]GIO90409.1 putative PTS system glucosamine-specific EIICBA component [Paenibacillus lactis]